MPPLGKPQKEIYSRSESDSEDLVVDDIESHSNDNPAHSANGNGGINDLLWYKKNNWLLAGALPPCLNIPDNESQMQIRVSFPGQEKIHHNSQKFVSFIKLSHNEITVLYYLIWCVFPNETLLSKGAAENFTVSMLDSGKKAELEANFSQYNQLLGSLKNGKGWFKKNVYNLFYYL